MYYLETIKLWERLPNWYTAL